MYVAVEVPSCRVYIQQAATRTDNDPALEAIAAFLNRQQTVRISASTPAEMRAAIALDPTRGDAHRKTATWCYYLGDFENAWMHVFEAEELGEPIPPQFRKLLAGKMPEPR